MGSYVKDLQINMAADSKSKDNDDVRRVIERVKWGNQIEFLLSCIGYAVGLGNLWRFPYLCMRNGGGAFLIPYFFFLFIGGVPLVFMELAIGQYSSLSPIAVWKLCPVFRGLGWGMTIISAIMTIYYNVIISWILYYLGHSFYKTLPWASCDNPWNTPGCLKPRSRSNDAAGSLVLNSSQIYHNVTEAMVVTTSGIDRAEVTTVPIPSFVVIGNQTYVHRTPAEEFWEYNVLQRSPGIEHFGGLRWELLACLVAAWLLTFLCLIKGVKTSGKVVYVTATFPYIFLTILCIRGVLLPGAVDGIKYYLTPDFNRLMEFRVWGEACLQIFYSLGPAWGGLITMASFNKFNHNIQRDAIVISLVNCGTSFFAGFVIFTIIGYMAHEVGLPVDEVITSGPGLVFMAYPEAIGRMPLSPLWAVIFFIMLLTIGLDSQFGMLETVVDACVDLYPGLLRGHQKSYVTASVCFIFLLCGLPFISRAGLYFFQITDWYSSMYSLTIIALLECLIIAWLYGWRRIYENLEEMLGHKPSQIWRILWCFVTPPMMTGIIIFSVVRVSEPSYGDYKYPRWAIGVGWFEAVVSLIPLPVFAVLELSKQNGSFMERLKKSVRPTADWGPARVRYEPYATTEGTAMEHL